MKIHNLESHRFADIFPMIEGNELEQLKLDIKEHGQLEPIILYDNKILDGRNRYKAIMELGLKPKFEQYKGEKPLEFVISLNLKRRHLTQSQAGVIALDVLPMLEEEAKKRINKGIKIDPPVILPEGRRERESSFQAGKLFNVSEKYVREAKKLKEESPVLLEEVRLGHLNFSQIRKQKREEKINKQREELQKEALEKPKGLYDVIVIDPPWKFEDDSVYDADGFRAANNYPSMEINDIANIELPQKKDCVLWLWTTNKHIYECKMILERWGYEPKTILTWNKINIGLGHWLRGQTEHCILAIKGNPYFNNRKYSTLLTEKRTTHSTKPESFYKMVEEICAGRKLDYFARKKRSGWDVYGDEI